MENDKRKQLLSFAIAQLDANAYGFPVRDIGVRESASKGDRCHECGVWFDVGESIAKATWNGWDVWVHLHCPELYEALTKISLSEWIVMSESIDTRSGTCELCHVNFRGQRVWLLRKIVPLFGSEQSRFYACHECKMAVTKG